ncbi:Cytidyltransferase, variant 3 [Balamuthia mandrillaris]
MSYYESKLSALYADIDHEDGCAYPNYCNGELRKTSRLDELEKEMQRKEVPETSPPGAPSDKELSQKEKEVFSSLSGLNDVVVPGSSSSSSSASASANSSSKEKDRAPIHFIYSVGCFDLFHYGHKILFSRMRRFGGEGCKLVIGVHDDLSIYKLKAKWPIDPLEKRLANVAKYADRAFVIPSTDPTPYLAAIIDKKEAAFSVYMRGNDMPTFPGRQLIEKLGMRIHLFPYTSSVSSTMLREKLLSGAAHKTNKKADPHHPKRTKLLQSHEASPQ